MITNTNRNFSQLSFLSDFADHLPGDPITDNHTRQVEKAAYSLVTPSPTRSPKLLSWSEDLAKNFNLSRPAGDDIQLLSGNAVLPDMKAYAARYGGHQFGHWAGQLGDGRALTLGEVKANDGKLWDFQLKGAGPTPYSRNADGRAVLRSSIREFICSEAMHFLGIPTTRALSVCTTGDSVIRDMFYDGHPAREPGAVVCRVAESFLRIGNFEIFAADNDTENLKKLTDYTIQRLYPELGDPSPKTYLTFFAEVCRRNILMCAEWMKVGFVHGVMNTDNMSILGLTIDYGPYGWIDDYDLGWTPNTTDLPGRRYAFGRQPEICLWNLVQLANALLPLVPDKVKELEEVLMQSQDLYANRFLEIMSQKLGIKSLDTQTDLPLLRELDELLQAAETDMTLFYRGLSSLELKSEHKDGNLPDFLLRAFYAPATEDLQKRWLKWLSEYRTRVQKDTADPKFRTDLINQANPIYVPRNYLVQECIEAATQGDNSKIDRLMEVLKNPYTEQEGAEHFAEKRPEWAKSKPGCSTLSCSS